MSAHHPDDMLLLDYSAGSLSPPMALAMAVHLSFCRPCREQLKRLNALGGVLLEEAKPASLDASAFDQLMSKIDDQPRLRTEPAPRPAENSGSSRGYSNPLNRYLAEPLDKLEWIQQTREIGKYDLTDKLKVQGFKVALQKIKAGAKVPTHTHKGTEITIVLQGSFSDELGVYRQGDFVARDPSHKHSPRAMQNEDCICLTVLDAPLKFTGPFMRLLNPFVSWLD